MVSTTACDPALVGKVALYSLVASAKVEPPADLLACNVDGSLWVVGTPCWGDAGRRSGACWCGCEPVRNWLLPITKGLVQLGPRSAFFYMWRLSLLDSETYQIAGLGVAAC